MPYNPEIHHRRSIRLKGYVYSQAGTYFVTICTQGRRCLFGDIINGETALNDAGKIAQQCWLEIPNHFPNTELDEFVIMPNHIHGIIFINDIVGAKNFSPLRNESKPHSPSKTIGSNVRGFKIGVTKWLRQNTDIYNVWQRNYYEHIIRDERDLNQIRDYIINNPIKWALDEYNPENVNDNARQSFK